MFNETRIIFTGGLVIHLQYMLIGKCPPPPDFVSAVSLCDTMIIGTMAAGSSSSGSVRQAGTIQCEYPDEEMYPRSLDYRLL